MNLAERDKKLIWHPFTQEKTSGLLLPITRGHGSYLYDEKDNVYLDLISSWWVNVHGHANEEIAEAIFRQSLKLEHVIFSGFTHEPAIEICEILKTILPEKFSKFFFSDNGSTAVEVALKMVYQYWVNKGDKERTTFICFEGGYHGDTFGAMSVGVGSGFHSTFTKLMFPVYLAPFPDIWLGDPLAGVKEKDAFDALKTYVDVNKRNIAGLIMEPLVQGAGGMRMCNPQFVKRVVNLMHQNKLLVIFDEVMTGFGRTGSNFAFEQVDALPDVLCLAKGLTGGFLPLSLTVTTEEIYQSFLDESYDKALAHGHSFTANPLGCAAAIAATKILIRPETKKAIATIEKVHRRGLEKLQQHLNVIDRLRYTGTISAFNVRHKNILPVIKSECLKAGLIVRPIWDTIYMIPPYTTEEEALDKAYDIICRILHSDQVKSLCGISMPSTA